MTGGGTARRQTLVTREAFDLALGARRELSGVRRAFELVDDVEDRRCVSGLACDIISGNGRGLPERGVRADQPECARLRLRVQGSYV